MNLMCAMTYYAIITLTIGAVAAEARPAHAPVTAERVVTVSVMVTSMTTSFAFIHVFFSLFMTGKSAEQREKMSQKKLFVR